MHCPDEVAIKSDGPMKLVAVSEISFGTSSKALVLSGLSGFQTPRVCSGR